MEKDSKKGFTLTELTVVLVILGIITAIAVPFALRYIKLAEFRKNEENAKTVYLAAESELTWYRTSGKWKEFQKEIIDDEKGKGVRNDTFSDAEKKERIYAISLNSDSAEQRSESEQLVRELLEDNIYEKDFLNAAITIEIDVETGHVYSAFYATHCESLAYEGANDKDILNISAAEDNRAYKNRRDRLLGYYSTEDVTNVVELKPLRLKVTTINLVNSETLSLNWSSNSRHDNLDVEFGITFYEKNKKEKLFSVTVNRDELIKNGHGPGSSAAAVPLSLKDKNGNSIGEWMFPLTYQESEGRSSRFSLTLDGMMSADLMESLEAAGAADIDKMYSTSITRLDKAVPVLEKPQDIYAEVEVNPTYQNMGKDAREYRRSSPVTSNTENTMFADAPKEKNGKQEVEISRFRHLSNIRYYKQNEETVFTLTGRNMDWTSEGTGLYTAQVQEANPSGAGSKRQLQWKSVKQGDTVLDFPSIRLLPKNYTVDGGVTAVSHMRLGADSVPSDEEIEKFYSNVSERQKHYTEYMGLFCEAEGKIRNLTLKNPELSLKKGEKRFDSLVGVGLVCGRSEGQMTDVRVETSAGGDAKTIEVYLADRAGSGGKDKQAAIGGLVGIAAKKDADGSLSALEPAQAGSTADNPVLKNLQMEGAVSGSLPEMTWTDGNEEDEKEQQQAAVSYQYGIGGIFGYASVKGSAKIEGCINHAKIEGNLFTGGIGGRLDGGYRSSVQTGSGLRDSNMENCDNDGMVLCTSGSADTAGTLNGRYFGGIVGYGMGMCIEDSSSASGRSDNYRYDSSKRDSLAGKYVGGIIGHGEDSQLVGCSTKKGGYILGSDHVGGIAGSLSSDVKDVIQGAQKGVAATVNASYVIGNRYVGGIVGENGGGDTDSTVYNCINNGVVAGYEYYIGGIAGYNGSKGTLENCASYLSDYDHSVFRMVRDDWKAVEGDCVGGLAGYNNGKIRLTKKNQALTVKSVSSIVTGNNFVGGMIGFNDTEGNLDLVDNYTLIGGQVEAAGSAVGGCIGLNASVKILGNTLEIKPSGVNGKYCVGGCIGANVVDLTTDMNASGLQANNTLGKITGAAFTGGMIGYQRTYAESQLGDGRIRILEYLSIADGNDSLRALAVKNVGLAADTTGFVPMLPKVNETNNIPTAVVESANQNCLTISRTGNTGTDLTQVNNNVPIQSYLYSGGVVGYCERGSRLVLLNCKNAGDISKPDEEGGLAAGVSLKAYLSEEGMTSAAGEIEDVNVSLVGGVISSNGRNQVIDHCANAGSMSGFVGLGGIVSFNSGGVFDCELADNFGNAGLDYIGGIAGLNVNAFVGASGSGAGLGNEYTYNGSKYTSGTIRRCSTGAGKSIFGRSYVGGIAGYNLSGGILEENRNEADVTASGNYAGGIAGSNKGNILLAADKGTTSRMVSGRSGTGIGGIAGINKGGGTIAVSAEGEEVIVVNDKVGIVGNLKVGGIAGINEGTLEVRSAAAMAVKPYLTCEAAEVRALAGHAGGIAGEARGDVTKARNKCKSVTANFGPAGGITAVNMKGISLISCQNLGNVNSDYGHAGGIVAENYGTIKECTVETSPGQSIHIQSRGADEIGAVCAKNEASARIEGCTVGKGVVLSGEGSVIGGIAGRNLGFITASENVKESPGLMPQVNVSAARLTVGGVAGRNEGSAGNITNLQASNLTFDGFSNYRYLGGIVGENLSEAGVSNCKISDVMIKEAGGAAGNCYGGIAGKNGGRLDSCEVGGITCAVQGIYTATSTSTAEQKEAQATHVGGVAGKNEETGFITECRLVAGNSVKTNTISAESGMAGGIAGYNNGNIKLSGDGSAMKSMQDNNGALVSDGEKLTERAGQTGIRKDSSYVEWKNISSSLEDLTYNGGSNLKEGRTLLLTMSVNGNIGGITAYNSPKASVNYCATGNWYIANKSEAIGVGTGGIIGMNESEKDQSFLLNQAFVGREIEGQIKKGDANNRGDTNRFAGGIIGNQNNTTAGGWKLKGCVNYGTVYCLRTHYSGGIIGQWTGTGGTVEDSYNFGNLQTTYNEGWVGAAAGIAAQLYHAYEGNEYNIISCKNFGNIYGRSGENYANSANDSGGILGNVTAYSSQTNAGNQRQNYKIQVLDCVNGPGVKIYSKSMASGIVGFLSSDSYIDNTATKIGEDTKNIELRIERCRNYAWELKGEQFVAGIFGDRYGETGAQNTVLEDCFSVNRLGSFYNKTNFPIVSMNNTAASKDGSVNYNKKGIYNYFLSDNARNSFILLGTTSVTENQLKSEASLDRVNSGCAYFLTKDGKQYLIYLDSSKIESNFKGSNLQINGNKVILNRQEVGEVIFEIENDEYGKLSDIVEVNSSFDEYVKKYYIQKETGGRNQMPAPERVELNLTDTNKDKIQIKVTPSAGTNPYKYTAVLYRSDKIGDGEEWKPVGEEFEFFTEDYSYTLPKEISALGGYLKVSVRAHSSDKTIMPSEERMSESHIGLGKVLPAPEIRIELRKDGGTNQYQYQCHLVNMEDYAEFKDASGKNIYKISVQSTDSTAGTEMEVDENGNMSPSLATGKTPLQQLIVQAKPTSVDMDIRESVPAPVPVYLPAYKPEISLAKLGGAQTDKNMVANPAVNITGGSLEDLRITVTLTTNGKNEGNQEMSVTTPPIYRADLIGTWDGRQNTVFDSIDMLTAANGTVSAAFANLPEELAEVSDLKVRIWYAKSGLGPVYTYYPIKDLNLGSLNGCIYTYPKEKLNELETGRTDVAEGQEMEWPYAFSHVLADTDFAKYRWNSNTLFKWLPRPNLTDVNLEPEYDVNNRLQYTFQWDQGAGEYQAGQKYMISLAGINENDDGTSQKVSIVTNKEISGNEYIADAEDWTYKKVELTVTRIGDTSGSEKTVGLTASKEYTVKQRLPRPAQPSAVNFNTDELVYAIEWAPVTPEMGAAPSNPQSGCVSYGIYVQPYAADGTTLETPALMETVPAGEKQPNGMYRKELNLENYAGRKAVIYIVAQARAEDVSYVNSVNGVTYELNIPARINAPQVVWARDWEYAPDQFVSVEEFEAEDELKAGRLRVTVTPDAGSIPPGDSSYLLKAYIFDSESEANTARTTIENGGILEVGSDGLLATCPAMTGNILPPNVMEVNKDGSYSATLRGISAEYAGKWLLIYTRISAGGGQISSDWAVNPDTWQLPYVQLPKPTTLVEDDYEQEIVVNAGTNPDMLGEENWTARQTALCWDGVRLADTYYVRLKNKDGTETEYRFVEEADAEAVLTGGKKIVVCQKKKDGQDQDIWEKVKMSEENPGITGPEIYSHQAFELEDYKMAYTGNYVEDGGLIYTYQVELNARLETEWSEEKGFTYRLILPDAVSLTSAKGTTVTDSGLRVTAEATVSSDVAENAPDGTSQSDAYQRSEDDQILF